MPAPPCPTPSAKGCSPPLLGKELLGISRAAGPMGRPRPAHRGIPLTSWMMLSDADCTLGFLAGEAIGSTCALKLTSCSS